MYYIAALAKGTHHTVEVRLTFIIDGNPAETIQDGVCGYIAITPPIEPGEILSTVTTAFSKPKLLVGTRQRQIYIQEVDAVEVGWTIDIIAEYYREAADRLVKLLDSVDDSTFFTSTY